MIEELIKKFNLSFIKDDNFYKELDDLDFNKKDIKKNYTCINIKINDLNTKLELKEKLNYLAYYNYQTRKIYFYSKNKITNDFYINTVDKILNFYDAIFKKENVYLIEIYLDNNPKLLKENNIVSYNNIIGGSNILKKKFIVIFREEEWSKVLIHELIHYTNLHIFIFQKELLYAFKNINTNSIIKPNEGYTEFLALIFYYYIYNNIKNNNNNNIINNNNDNNIINNNNINNNNDKDMLTKEMAWGFIQCAKILKNRNFNSYQELFSGKEYSQDTSILSYYFLKTYFLYNSKYQKCIKLDYMDKYKDNYKCFKDINLQDDKFTEIINYCINNLDLNDKSLKMSLTN